MAPQASARRLRTSFFLGLVAVLVATLFAARNLATWPPRLAYPGEEAYEGTPLAEVVQLQQGVPIYAPPRGEGFADVAYGPLYYFLGSHVVDSQSPSYLGLRLLSVLATLGCAAGCGLLAFWLTRSWLAASLGPSVFLSYAMVTRYGILALSDGVALFLFFCGFLVAYRFRARRALLFAAPLMLLGFYYKPQYVAGPMAAFVFLVLEKNYRRAAQFAGLLALGGVGLLAIFQWAVFPRQEFWRHFLVYEASFFNWQRFGHALLIFALMFFIPVLLAAEYLRTYPDRMMGCYLAFTVLLGLLTFSKHGSGVHYFFECVLATSTLVPGLLAKRLEHGSHPIDLVLLLGVMLLAGQAYGKRAPQRADFADHEAVQSFLRRNFPSRGRALGASPGDLVQAGLETPFSGLFLFVQLAHRGSVSDRDLVAKIRSRWFSVIVLNFNLREERDPYWLNFYLTAPMRNAIDHGYQVSTSLDMPTPEKERAQDRFYIYVPR